MYRLFFIVVFQFVLTLSAHAQDRHALIIGVDAYAELIPLERAVNDARAIGMVANQAGFEALTVIDPTRADMIRALDQFVRRLGPDDEALVFYAGHAVSIGNENYLIPADASVGGPITQTRIVGESIAMSFILDQIGSSGARLTVAIIDACRDNPFEELATRSGFRSGGLSVSDPPRGVFLLFSADEGQTALDSLGATDTHPNSVFTRTLLPLLAEPGLDIVDAARRLRGDVEALAATVGHAQFPVYRDRMRGAAGFVMTPIAATAPQEEEPPQPLAPDPTVPAVPDFGRVELSPRVARIGDSLNVEAIPPVGCMPQFFSLDAGGAFTPISAEFFEQQETTLGPTRYTIDAESRFGLVVTEGDALGVMHIGFFCLDSGLQTPAIAQALLDLPTTASAGVLSVASREIVYATATINLTDQ